jgi:hypothetical protein
VSERITGQKMTSYEMISVPPFRDKAQRKFEAAQAKARADKRIVAEALEAIRLSKPYKRDEDVSARPEVSQKEWDQWVG